MGTIDYKLIVGMEIHVELKTVSKMFCGCKNDPFHAPKPNIYTCPVCLGLPGALPVPNRKAVEWTIMLGLALGCQIPLLSKFDRKNYFYPDLPKGYQISQYDQPIARGGALKFKVPTFAKASADKQNSKFKIEEEKTVRIQRVHLEEDTGKLIHQTVNGERVTLIDFNRSGVPLVEIVTEPDIESGEEAKVFLKKLHQIIRYLGISAADMEKGSMRLEPNISVKLANSIQHTADSRLNEELPPYKVEVKNINSFKFVKKAIEYEKERQMEILERGEIPAQETRGWDEKKGVTLPQRSKEAAHDYRYFPEPDIPPIKWEKNLIRQLAEQIPELPPAKLSRFIKDYHLLLPDAESLVETRELADYFEQCIKSQKTSVNVTAKMVVNWLINKKPDIHKVPAEELVKQITQAKTVVVTDEKELMFIIQKVIAANAKAVTDYKSGKPGVIMFLVGMVMRELKGKGDANTIRLRLEKELQSI